jgi:hypothetical protein
MSPPRALEEPALVIVYAIGVACWLLAPEEAQPNGSACDATEQGCL